jgi:hypothetical protein
MGVHTAQGLREEAQRCFRLAEGATDKRLREELLAYGRELIDRAERMDATGKTADKAVRVDER